MAGLTFVDLGLIAVALISGLLAMYRGFVRELLSVLSWVFALGTAAYIMIKQKEWAGNLLADHVANQSIAALIVAAIVFVLTLIIIHLITGRLSDAVLDSNIGPIDRILGFAFGAARGFLIIVILFLLYGTFVKRDNWSKGVAQAKSLPYLEQASHAITSGIDSIAPDISKHLKSKDDVDETKEDLKEGKPLELKERIKQAAQNLGQKKTYRKDEKAGLNRLFDVKSQ